MDERLISRVVSVHSQKRPTPQRALNPVVVSNRRSWVSTILSMTAGESGSFSVDSVPPMRGSMSATKGISWSPGIGAAPHSSTKPSTVGVPESQSALNVCESTRKWNGAFRVLPSDLTFVPPSRVQTQIVQPTHSEFEWSEPKALSEDRTQIRAPPFGPAPAS